MKYVSIDIETTGLDPHFHQIIEFGAVIDDLSLNIDKLPRLHFYIDNGNITGDPYALTMNAGIIKTINEKKLREKREGSPQDLILPGALSTRIYEFLDAHDLEMPINIAGKNFASFDLPFLRLQVPGFDSYIKYRHRFLDPAILYWQPGDNTLPDTETCMKRAGIKGKVAHNAIEDAIVVVKLIRKKLR